MILVHQVSPKEIVGCVRDPVSKATYLTHVGPDRETIEQRISEHEWADSENEGKFIQLMWRLAFNACMLAATRQTKTDPLPDNIARKRARKGDNRVRCLAARHCQEISFRDLVIYDRVKTSGDGEKTGVTYGPQKRRGHWKKVLYGPKHSLSRRTWINDYWTHKELKFGSEQPTIVMK